jgi:AbrB family looped-hinge helix DNA binding protein
MSMTVTMDAAGCIELPKRVRSRFQLKERSRLEMDITGDSITLRPKQAPAKTAAKGTARLTRKGGLLVATGFPSGVDIAAALEADREERDAELAAPLLRRSAPRR